jgi:hypothetical protein
MSARIAFREKNRCRGTVKLELKPHIRLKGCRGRVIVYAFFLGGSSPSPTRLTRCARSLSRGRGNGGHAVAFAPLYGAGDFARRANQLPTFRIHVKPTISENQKYLASLLRQNSSGKVRAEHVARMRSHTPLSSPGFDRATQYSETSVMNR